MSNTIGCFGYVVYKTGESDEIPMSPVVRINLERWSNTDDGAPAISPNLMTESEIDNYIGDLKKDLDAVGRRAKTALKRAHKSTTEILAKKRST